MQTEPSPKRGRCPYCSKEFTYTSVSQHKCFPFCCSRCRDIDLGKWFTGAYAVPGVDGSAFDSDDEMSPDRDAT